MEGKIVKVSGNNITFSLLEGTVIIPVKYAKLLDEAIENLGVWYIVKTDLGKVTNLKKRGY